MVSNFLFHRVCPERDALWDPMDVRLFRKCIDYISKNFEIYQLETLMERPKSIDSRRRIATIVFDDGYKDNINYAAPILEAYKIKASFYVVTDCIETNIPTWTYILDYSFQFTKKYNIDLNYDFLPPELRVKKFNNYNERIAYARKLKPALKLVSNHHRVQVLEKIKSVFNDVSIPSLMMDWNDVEELKSAGHYIGSHTVTHPALGKMSKEEDIQKEMFNSAKQIENKLGYFPLTISYPFGSYNANVISICKEVGYQLGLAVNERVFNPEKDSVFEISRIELYNESWLKTRLRIDSVIEKISKFLGRT